MIVCLVDTYQAGYDHSTQHERFDMHNAQAMTVKVPFQDDVLEMQAFRFPESDTIRIYLRLPGSDRWEFGHTATVPYDMDYDYAMELVESYLVGDLDHDLYASALEIH